MKIKPIKSSILFEFSQAVRDGFFKQETEWGFAISGTDYQADKPRWGKVIDVGPDAKYVSIGDYILIDALKWTTAVEVNDKKVWRTDESCVLLRTDEKPEGML